MTAKRAGIQYLEIVAWDEHLHPDQSRKVKPPFRWMKLKTEDLEVLGDLTVREYGAYCRLILLAGLTNNRTILNHGWLRRRAGLSRQLIETLSNRHLIRIVSNHDESEKIQQKQPSDSKSASGNSENTPQNRRLEGKGGEGIRSDLIGGDRRAPPGIKPNGRQPTFEVMTQACQAAGIQGSNWNAIRDVIEREFNLLPTDKQLSTIERQLNDRAGK